MAEPRDISTGSCSSCSNVRSVSVQCEPLSDHFMPSYPGAAPQTPTCGKKTPPLPEPGFRWARSLFDEAYPRTGKTCGSALSEENSIQSLETLKFVISGTFSELVQCLHSLYRLSENVSFTGARLAWGSPVERGPKQDWTLILKFRHPNFGTAIEVTNTLWLTSFVEVSTLDISSDGLTGTQYWSKSKGPLSSWLLKRFGSQAI